MTVENKWLALVLGALSELGFKVWVQKWCGLVQWFPSVFGIVFKFPRQKSSNISPYFCSGNLTGLCLRCIITHKNAILTKLSTWEYGNGNTLFSRWKSGRVSRLVLHDALVGFRVYVCGAYRYAHTLMSQSPSKHQACWCVLHTRGNHCYWVIWIGTITPRWSCTQYNMNMHLRQSPWANTHTTRSWAFMTREGHSHSHESPSYKVHNHSYTSKYRYTCIMHNATT